MEIRTEVDSLRACNDRPKFGTSGNFRENCSKLVRDACARAANRERGISHADGATWSVSGQVASAKFDVFFGRMGGTASIEGLDVTPFSSRRVAVAYIFAIVGIGTPSQAELEAGCDLAEQKADALLAAGPDPHGLRRDEIAAIHLYTQELMYRPLNRALWSKERSAVKAYWGYIRHALFKVPKCVASVAIYRGIKDPYEPIAEEAAMLAMATESSVAHPDGGSGEPVMWWGFSSCSTNQQPVMAFLGQDPATVRVLYTIEGGSSARDVRRYSAYQEEAEVLMPFGSAFTVVTASAPAPNLLLVTLRQTHEFAYAPTAVPGPVAQQQGGQDLSTHAIMLAVLLLVVAVLISTSVADCGAIENCVTVGCTTGGVAVCAVCEDGLLTPP